MKQGYIEDLISGIPVRATPEEVEAAVSGVGSLSVMGIDDLLMTD